MLFQVVSEMSLSQWMRSGSAQGTRVSDTLSWNADSPSLNPKINFDILGLADQHEHMYCRSQGKQNVCNMGCGRVWSV